MQLMQVASCGCLIKSQSRSVPSLRIYKAFRVYCNQILLLLFLTICPVCLAKPSDLHQVNSILCFFVSFVGMVHLDNQIPTHRSLPAVFCLKLNFLPVLSWSLKGANQLTAGKLAFSISWQFICQSDLNVHGSVTTAFDPVGNYHLFDRHLGVFSIVNV